MFNFSAQIFDLAFNYYALLSLFGIILNLILLYLVIYRGLKNSTNNWFTLFLCTIVIWGISEFFGRLSATQEGAIFWGNFGAPGWLFLGPTYFSFVISFVGKENLLEGLGRKFIAYGPGLIFLFLVWTTNLVTSHSGFHKVPWGWTNDNGPLFIVFAGWLEIFFISALVILIRYYFKSKDPSIKKQSLLLATATIIPLFIGTITDISFPILDINFPGTAILFTSVLGAVATYATLKYQLFVINPATHLSSIVETMNEALLVFNMADLVEFNNKAVERLFGYKKEELIGQGINKLIKTEEALQLFRERFRKPLTSGNLVNNLEMSFYAKDGTEIPVSLAGSILRDSANRDSAYIVVASDMREVKKLVYNLVAERNKLSITLSGVSEGVFVVDKEGVISFFNQAAEKIFGVSEKDVLGKKADEIFNIKDDEGKILVQYFFPKERLSKDMVTYSRNGVKIERADGLVVYANLIAANIVEGEDVNLGAIVTLHDVSKEKDLEEMKLDFVSMAAHELRTPLTSIRGYLSVLQEETKGTLSEEQGSFLDKAFISSTQLAALVENLLSVSRIERGSLQIQSQVTAWEPLVEEAYNNFLPQARERKVGLTYLKPKTPLPLVQVDKFRISEVISNLVGNALNYTPSGGSVEISLEVSKDEVITHVRDTGSGIPASAIPKLFTKFFRVSGVLEQGSKGTGLGLYISKAIVDMHKGRIWVESDLGKGSSFSFSVPVSLEQKMPELAPGIPDSKKMFFRKSPKK